MSPTRSVLLASLVAAGAAAAEPQKPACALVKACGLAIAVPGCTADLSRPVRGVIYDASRCSEPRDLLAHGVVPEVGMGAFVYPFLGRRYRLVYDITGEAPISEARFNYLAQDLPLASRLATRFSKTRYSIQYVNLMGRRFHASRADKLKGDAELLFLDSLEKRRTYYGWGTSTFGPWTLHGSGYLDLRIRTSAKDPKRIAYEVRIRTAPANRIVNAIMGLGLFKRHVIGQIGDTIKDLVGAAAALTPSSIEAILTDPTFSPDEREKVRALAALPD